MSSYRRWFTDYHLDMAGDRGMKSGEYSKKIINFILIAVVLFTIAILWVFYKTGSEPQVLVGCVFAFVTGELWALAFIKGRKIDKGGE